MTEEEKIRFLENVHYFWFEKGDLERLSGFTIEKLREADPVLALVYERLQVATQTFNRLLRNGE